MKQPVKAVIYGGVEHGLILSIYRENRQYEYYRTLGDDLSADAHRNNRNRLGWYLAGTLLMSMLDAYVDAHLYNFDVSDDFGGNETKKTKEGLSILGVKVNFSWRFE